MVSVIECELKESMDRCTGCCISITDCHDMTLAVKVALNPNTTNQIHPKKEFLLVCYISFKCFEFGPV